MKMGGPLEVRDPTGASTIGKTWTYHPTTHTRMLDIRESTARLLQGRPKFEILLVKCWHWEKGNYRVLH